jgi:LPS export ABC transporter protein LptC
MWHTRLLTTIQQISQRHGFVGLLLGLVSLSSVIWWQVQQQPATPVTPPPQSLDFYIDEARIVQFSNTPLHRSQQPAASITAITPQSWLYSERLEHWQQRDEVIAHHPHFELLAQPTTPSNQPTVVPATITAQTGKLSPQFHEMLLSGNVHLTRYPPQQPIMTLTTTELWFDQLNEQLQTHHAVTMIQGNNTVQGSGMTLDNLRQTMDITQPRMVLTPSKTPS